MNPNPDIATHGEITLVDYVWISGILIFVTLVCLCIVLLADGARRATSVFTETTQSKSNAKAYVQFGTAITQPERYYLAPVSPSSQFSSETPNQLNNRDKTDGATGGTVTSDVPKAKAFLEHHGNLVMMWKAISRRSAAHSLRKSSTFERRVPKSVKKLIEMWRRAADANK